MKGNLLPAWNSWSKWKDKSWLKITDRCRLTPWRFLQVRIHPWQSTIWASGEEGGHHLETTSGKLRVERCLEATKGTGTNTAKGKQVSRESHRDGFSEPRKKLCSINLRQVGRKEREQGESKTESICFSPLPAPGPPTVMSSEWRKNVAPTSPRTTHCLLSLLRSLAPWRLCLLPLSDKWKVISKNQIPVFPGMHT